jgi:hypothetical protein
VEDLITAAAARTCSGIAVPVGGLHRFGVLLDAAGYATPEAALETITYNMIFGSYDQCNEGLGPEMLPDELKDPNQRERFEARQKMMAPLFKGLQIFARKAVAEDKVELKVKMDANPLPNQETSQPEFLVQPMIKVGEFWKLGGSTRGHEETWNAEGQIQTFLP